MDKFGNMAIICANKIDLEEEMKMRMMNLIRMIACIITLYTNIITFSSTTTI